MAKIKNQYDIWLFTEKTGKIKAAEIVLLEDYGNLEKLGFRYSTEYLDNKNAFSLDPSLLPLNNKEVTLDCQKGVPGILDDYLPDDWGRKIILSKYFHQYKKKMNALSDIDILSQLSDSRIGATHWVKKSEEPNFQLGSNVSNIEKAEDISQHLDNPEKWSNKLDELSLIYLANNGSGVGGARPKALMSEQGIGYVAKFNRLKGDEYNNAKVESLCLKLAKLSGLEVPNAKVISGINGRDVLSVERFDIDHKKNDYPRSHLITVNALLKDKKSHRIISNAFRYDDIAELISKYSDTPISDMEQLLKLMFFNSVINNTDTHERNFSFMNNGEGYKLAPAYDLVPSLTTNEYPLAGYKYSSYSLHPKEAITEKIFGLSKIRCKEIAEEVIEGCKLWEQLANEENLSDEDYKSMKKIFKNDS